MKKIVILLIIAIIVVSCKSTVNRSNDSIPKVSLEAFDKSNIVEVKLSEISNKISYIPLETNSDIFIEDYDFKIGGDFIFVCSKKKLFQFRHDGSFVNQVGALGKGPGEFRCSSFDIDSKNEYVYVFDYWLKKVFQFDFNKNLISSFNVPGIETIFYINSYSKDTILYSTNTNTVIPEIVSYCISSSKTNYVQKGSNENQNNTGILKNDKIIYKYNNQIRFSHIHNDTLFYINQFKVYPYMIIERGKYMMKPEYTIVKLDQPSQMINKLELTNIVETDKFIFIDYLQKSKDKYLALYNKETKEFYSKVKIVNDLDGGVDIDENLTLIQSTNNKILICIPANLYNGKAVNSGPKVDEFANPVLMEIQLQK